MKPVINIEHAVAQAGKTVDQYLVQAKKMIVENNLQSSPQLLTTLVHCQVLDVNNDALVNAIYELAEAIKEKS